MYRVEIERRGADSLNTAIHTLFAERQKALLLRTIYFIRCSDLFGNANMNPPVRLQLVRVKVERKFFLRRNLTNLKY